MLKLEIHPLSNNALWRGRVYRSKRYNDYEETMLWLIASQNPKKYKGWVAVDYKFYLNKYYTNSDVFNYEKALSDILEKAGVIEDDKYIKRGAVEKFLIPKDETEHIMVKVEKYEQT